MRAPRLIAPVAAITVAMAFGSTGAYAKAPTTDLPTTVQELDQTSVTEDFQNPCTGVTGTATLVLHMRVESTENRSLYKADATGTMTFQPYDTGQPSYAGTLELHEFAINEVDPTTNTRDFVGKHKSVIRLRGTDRSKIVIRARLKNVIKNDVLKVSIEKGSLSCG